MVLKFSFETHFLFPCPCYCCKVSLSNVLPITLRSLFKTRKASTPRVSHENNSKHKLNYQCFAALPSLFYASDNKMIPIFLVKNISHPFFATHKCRFKCFFFIQHSLTVRSAHTLVVGSAFILHHYTRCDDDDASDWISQS